MSAQKKRKSYDANQLKKVKWCSGSQTIAEYVYDGSGNRMVKKHYNYGTLMHTVYSWSDLFETKVYASGGSAQSTSYYFINNELVSKKDNSGTRTYFHNDHLGSTTVVTNQAGTLVEQTKYDPWGEVNTGGTVSKFQYTGQERDTETGLNYYNFRYYDPHIRRFTQPDDVIQNVYDPQTLNRYAYVRNNPLKYTDPTGHNFVLTTIVAALVVTAAVLMPAIMPNTTANEETMQAVKTVSTAIAERASNTMKTSMDNWDKFWKMANNALGNNEKDKKVPNPDGRKGGEAHQATISKKVEELKLQGYKNISQEFKVNTPGGAKPYRFGDIYAESPSGEKWIFQIGKQTKSGIPIARERQALNDMTNFGKEEFMLDFLPYN